jgi:osmotically-inducible protein OsmY
VDDRPTAAAGSDPASHLCERDVDHAGTVAVEAEGGIGGPADLLRLLLDATNRKSNFLRSLRNRSAPTPIPQREGRRNAVRCPITQRKEDTMSLDTDLTADVSDELFWDPKVDNAAIAVSATEGKITLRGTVGSLREKREAKKAAQRVFGVISVDNQLQVKLMNDDRRADADLRGDVLQALMLDSLVPATVDAKAEDGFVTLSGSADWQYQRDEADFVASNIVGTLDVFDEIELTHPKPNAGDVQDSIKKAFKRNAALDADNLYISSDNGTVTITGNVSSWAEHDEALDAAWAAPGVTSVRDEMTIGY